MCYFMDILIYYFSPISQSSHFMQSKSSEILSSKALSVFPTCQPCDLSALEQKPVSSLRVVFGQWIRTLPMEERFVAVKIHVPQVVSLIKHIFCPSEHLHPETIGQSNSEHLLESKKFSRRYEKIFYDSLVFVSDGQHFLDHICFDYALLESPEKLFDLLTSPSEALANRPLSELIKPRKDFKSLNQRLYKMASREQLSYQLFGYLRQQVFVNFYRFYKNSESIAKSLEEEKKRKKQFNNNWKYLSQEMKEKLLLLGLSDIEALCDWLNDHGIPVKLNEIQKEFEELLRLQRNDFCNRIFKCKLKKILSPIINYYELVYHQWKKEIDKFRKKRGLKYNRSEREFSSQQKSQCKESSKQQHHKRNKKPRKSNSLESNETNETEGSKTCTQKKHLEGKSIQLRLNQNNHENQSQENSEKRNSTQKLDRSLQQSTHFCKGLLEKQQKKPQSKIQINPQTEDPPELYSTPKKPISICSTSTQLSSRNSESQIQSQIQKQAKEDIRKICISKLNDELQQISDKISQEANEFHDRRVIAFQRIQFLLQFYNVPIKLFGSCASGIAVRNSDIDIAIDNSILTYMDFLPEPERIRSALQKLQQLFQTQAWITEIKFIKTAAIPLIKLTIDTSLPFFDPSIGEMYYELNRQHNCGAINADITVQTKNKSEQCSHLGLISTNAINKWLNEISSLHSIIIILKEFFSRKRLNCTYQGGLNTFSMIVLMVAYIFHAKLQQEQNAALVFERILRFYVEQFNERQRGIDIVNRQSNNIFYIKNLVNVEGCANKLAKQKADLQIKDPMNQQKNMTRNCYSFEQIRTLFKGMLQNCFSRGYRQLEDIVKMNQGVKEGKLSLEQTNRDAFAKRNVFIQFLNSIC